jgi:hypothetical protein
LSDPIRARLERQAGFPGLVDALAERLKPSDLQSLLLYLHEALAQKVTPSDLLAHYETSRFVRPAPIDVQALLRFELQALQLLPPGFEALELAPVTPLATHSGLATVHQNKVLTTNRNNEVVADSTNVMALESALRRRAALRADPRATTPIKLYTSHRLTRAQKFEGPGMFGHFRLMALTTAGRDSGGLKFESDTLLEHLDYHLRVLDTADGRLRGRILLTELDDVEAEARWRDAVLDRLAAAHPLAELDFDPTRQSGRGYYSTLCFKIHCRRGEGEWLEVGDGGFTDWTQKLLSNRKERFLTSCLASERVVRMAAGEA